MIIVALPAFVTADGLVATRLHASWANSNGPGWGDHTWAIGLAGEVNRATIGRLSDPA